MKTLSIIIPVYNEQKTLPEIVRRVEKVRLPGIQKEIILVDDCSTDGSKEVVKELAKQRGRKAYFHTQNKGKGAALKTGYAHATGDFITIQDADLEYDPNDYARLLRPLLENRAKVVYGSRFLGKKFKLLGKKRVFLPTHYLGNKFLIFFTNLLYGSKLTEMETCYKMFPRNLLQELDLQSNGWGETPEFTGKMLKLGYDIYEVPIHYQPRGYEEGKKINWRAGFVALWMLLKVRLFWKPKKKL